MHSSETVLISGASGLIGRFLSRSLKDKGYQVIQLVRNKSAQSSFDQITYHELNGDEKKNLLRVDHIIHLAGASIGEGRWTKKRKRELRDSRIETAKFLFEKFSDQDLKTWITASGVAWYGNETSEKVFKEDDAAGDDFLAGLTVEWEKAANVFSTKNVRVAAVRTGVVLAPQAEVLKKMLTPFKWNFGAVLGKGTQFFPWIHIEDLCNVYLTLLENKSLSGSFNAVAPQFISNAQLTKDIALVLKKKVWLPAVPGWILKLILGEMSSLVLTGNKISSDKIQKTGYVFKHTDFKAALRTCVGD
ncbi:MAG: TIGR01777 family protein [Crocinitomicaceae bacterium]|nr:TIGR01777 family protein [Crocinitomicaceae bacterium]MBK8927103.1 TIGR01777 family protein [Crocinitomicaceae bacterium]